MQCGQSFGVLLDELLQGAPAQAQVLDRVRQVAGRGASGGSLPTTSNSSPVSPST